jgi:chromosome segregation ATPase
MSKFPKDENSADQISLEKELEMDEEDPDLFYRDDMRDLERSSDVQRLSNRMTMLFILIPCLLCAIFVFAYLDIREKLNQFQSTGSSQVQALAEDVVGNVRAMGNRLSTLEKSSVSIQENLEKDQREIRKLVTSKVDKEAFERTGKKRSAQVTGGFSALRKEMAAQKASVEKSVKQLGEKLDEGTATLSAFRDDLVKQKKELAEVLQVIEVIRNEARKQELDISHLSEDRLDKEQLDNLFKEQRTGMSLLQQQIQSLKGDVLWMEKELNLTGKRSKTPAPGTIIEQDIAE